MGRTTLLNDDLKTRLVVAAEAVYHYKYTAGLCGISVDALEKYRKEDEDLSARLEEARSRFIKNHMRKAKPEFLLQTSDREVFGEKKQLDIKINPVREILEAAGLLEGENNERKDDGTIAGSSQDQTQV